jgi:hypothetical protein
MLILYTGKMGPYKLRIVTIMDKCTTSYTLRMVDEEILIYDSVSSTLKMGFTCWFLKLPASTIKLKS